MARPLNDTAQLVIVHIAQPVIGHIVQPVIGHTYRWTSNRAHG